MSAGQKAILRASFHRPDSASGESSSPAWLRRRPTAIGAGANTGKRRKSGAGAPLQSGSRPRPAKSRTMLARKVEDRSFLITPDRSFAVHPQIFRSPSGIFLNWIPRLTPRRTVLRPVRWQARPQPRRLRRRDRTVLRPVRWQARPQPRPGPHGLRDTAKLRPRPRSGEGEKSKSRAGPQQARWPCPTP